MIIETERLHLRPLGLADIDEFVALHGDAEVTRFIRRFERHEAEDRLRLFAREWVERGHGMFAVLDRASGRFLGRAGLKYWPQFDETELGWVLRRDAWGHGYGTEAARACRDWGSRPWTCRMTAMIHPDNEASIRLARRLGMAPLRSDVLLGDASWSSRSSATTGEALRSNAVASLRACAMSDPSRERRGRHLGGTGNRSGW